MRLAFAGAVLDAGCGTGENALHIASRGLSVLGVDVAETALAMAREKARDRGIDVEFGTADALHLERREELRAAFKGWKVVAIEAERLQTRFHDDGAPAWLATMKRMSS